MLDESVGQMDCMTIKVNPGVVLVGRRWNELDEGAVHLDWFVVQMAGKAVLVDDWIEG